MASHKYLRKQDDIACKQSKDVNIDITLCCLLRDGNYPSMDQLTINVYERLVVLSILRC